jgi:hypothetical protein
MKLSEAIRIGAAKRPQAFGDYLGSLLDGTPTTCALGAAYEACTNDLPPSAAEDFGMVIRELERMTSTPRDLLLEVVNLNDEAYRTREQIAD